MCKVLKFQGTGASFRSRLSPGARLWYRPGADICYRIENHKRVKLRYAVEELEAAYKDELRVYNKILEKITAKQFNKIKHLQDRVARMSALRKHTKSRSIQHLIHCFISEAGYRMQKQQDVNELQAEISA